MKALTLLALLSLSACATNRAQESIDPGYQVLVSAHGLDPGVLVEASISQEDGEVIVLPRVLMLAGSEASIFVGESSGEELCPDGIHGQFQTQGDQILVSVQIVEGGVELWSQEQLIQIESAEDN